MKTVYLHGKLGRRFGKKWNISVNSVGEIIGAIDANADGFMEYMLGCSLSGEDYFFLKKNPKEIECESDLIDSVLKKEEVQIKSKCSEIHIVPKVYGGVVGAILTKMAITGLANTIITSMVWGAIVQVAMNALFKPPKSPKSSAPVSTKSFLLQGASNRQAQNIPVPIGYGRLKIGASNISTTKKTMPLSKKPKKVERRGVSSVALESYTEITYLDLLCEGPIEGFVNKYGGVISGGDIREGIFLNDVQVKNTSKGDEGLLNYILKEDEEENPPEIKLGGQKDSKILSSNVSSVIDYDQLLYGGSPYHLSGTGRPLYFDIDSAQRGGAKMISHTVINENTSRVLFSFKSELSKAIEVGGKKDREQIIVEDTLHFGIYIYRNNKYISITNSESGCNFFTKTGSSVTAWGEAGFKLTGLATSPYQFDIEVEFNRDYTLAEKAGGVVFKVVKFTSEWDPSVKGGSVGGLDRTANLQLAHIEEIVESKMLYPHTSVAKITFDSKNFSNVPNRSYHLKLKKVLIPSNYDPMSRSYNGPWDGLFKGQQSSEQSINEISDDFRFWTDNPVWVFFDLISSYRYGLGKYGLEEQNIDKWQLYKIAKYCDELVETDYPIETMNSIPIGFETYNIDMDQSIHGFSNSFAIRVDDSFFDIGLDGNYEKKDRSDLSAKEIRDIFVSEFGEGESYKGKKIAFFIYQHSFQNERLNNQQIEEIKSRSAKRQKEYIIEERVIINSDPNSRIVIVTGPNFKNNASAFIGEDSGAEIVAGACASQINHAVVEPRFSCNIYMTDRSRALDMINSMTAVFRGMAAYTAGKIFATQDSFRRPVLMFNNSNVSNEGFRYSGTKKTKRVTSSLVRFNNKDKNFKPDIVYEEDADAMRRVGFIENETLGFGITSESQARRLAKWVLFTSQLETETIRFKSGQEASYLLPGSIFEVSDEYRSGVDRSGRVLGVFKSRKFYFNEQEILVEEPHILIDKSIRECPSISDIEIAISCGANREKIKLIEKRAQVNNSEEDQDIEIDAIDNPQIIRFNGAVSYISSREGDGVNKQKTIITNLMYKREFKVDIALNTIKSFNHDLSDGENISFLSEGVLPGGIENKFIYKAINTTKHTFQIYKYSSDETVNIVDIGRDRFMNKGGSHYFLCESEEKLSEALNQIHIGAPYSIKGLVGTKDVVDWTRQQKEALGAQEESNQEFMKSDFLGFVSAENEWIFSPTMTWVYIDQLRRDISNVDQMWLFEKDIGWFWTNNTIRDEFWYILSINKWVNIIYNSDEKEYIDAFFIYEDVQQSQLFVGDLYTLGESKMVPVLEVYPNGYILGLSESVNIDSFFVENFDQQEQLLEEINLSENPGYNKTGIKELHPLAAEDSSQGKESILLELFDGHGLEIDKNNNITIEQMNSGNLTFDSLMNKKWTTIYVNKNAVELIESSQEKTMLDLIPYSDFGKMDDEQSIGFITYIIGPESRVQRNLESQLFRTLSVKEVSENQFEVTGLEYNASKFDFIDKKGVSRKPRSPIPPQADMNIPESPENLILTDLTL
jgi:predicted phage tail protein